MGKIQTSEVKNVQIARVKALLTLLPQYQLDLMYSILTLLMNNLLNSKLHDATIDELSSQFGIAFLWKVGGYPKMDTQLFLELQEQRKRMCKFFIDEFYALFEVTIGRICLTLPRNLNKRFSIKLIKTTRMLQLLNNLYPVATFQVGFLSL